MMNWRRTAMLLLIGSAIAATPAFAKDDRVSFATTSRLKKEALRAISSA